jgi:hypothetical protein
MAQPEGRSDRWFYILCEPAVRLPGTSGIRGRVQTLSGSRGGKDAEALCLRDTGGEG